MPDMWTERDLPVLKTIIQLIDEDPGQPIPRQRIEQAAGMDEDTVRRAVFSLMDEPYLETIGSAEDGHEYIYRVLGSGKRAAEFWPTPESMTDTLRDALLRAAEAEPDPGKRSKLKALGGFLAEGGRDLVVEVIKTGMTGGFG